MWFCQQKWVLICSKARYRVYLQFPKVWACNLWRWPDFVMCLSDLSRIYTDLYRFIRLYMDLYWFILIYYIYIYIDLYWFILICIDWYWFVLIYIWCCPAIWELVFYTTGGGEGRVRGSIKISKSHFSRFQNPNMSKKH